MKILISGFDPIWGIRKTPSGEIAKLWQSKEMPVPDGLEIKSLVLPQQFGVSTEIVCAEINSFQPDGVIMFGATMKNDPIRLERFAVNCEHSPMGDNTKIPVHDRPVIAGGPSSYESTLPVYHLVEKLEGKGIKSKASYHAGTHVCNSIMYGVLDFLKNKNQTGKKISAGFVHVAFPNSFGVSEDELWDTETWPKLVQSSVVLIHELANWLDSNDR